MPSAKSYPQLDFNGDISQEKAAIKLLKRFTPRNIQILQTLLLSKVIRTRELARSLNLTFQTLWLHNRVILRLLEQVRDFNGLDDKFWKSKNTAAKANLNKPKSAVAYSKSWYKDMTVVDKKVSELDDYDYDMVE